MISRKELLKVEARPIEEQVRILGIRVPILEPILKPRVYKITDHIITLVRTS